MIYFTKYLKILLTVIFLLSTHYSFSQWWYNSTSDLETDITGIYSGSGMPFNNIIIDNQMAIGCGTTTYLGTSYPLVVSGIADGSTILLLSASGTDIVRKIVGRSTTGGVAIYSGNDNTDGSGILLNAISRTGHLGGMVQTISKVSGTSNDAFEHLNGSTNIFSINTSGDLSVKGKLSFNYLGGDINMRSIEGLSTAYGLNIYSGTSSAPGTEISLYGPGSPLSNQINFDAAGPAGITPGLAFNFKTNSTLSLSVLQINNDGTTRLGGYGTPVTGTKLTVDGDIYINSLDNSDATFRNIFSNSSTAGLNIFSGSASSRGTELSLFAASNATSPGLIQLNASGPTGSTGLAYKLTLSTTPTSISAVQINNDGTTRIGNYGSPEPYTQLTIDGDVHINSPDNNDGTFRNIYARSLTSGINLSAGSTPFGFDGASMTALGLNLPPSLILPGFSAPIPGAYVVYAHGDPLSGVGNTYPVAFAVENFNPDLSHFGDHSLFHIRHNGQAIIGYDIDLSRISNNDVFTVKNYLGFYAPADVYGQREIHGNATVGSLNMYSGSAFNGGSGLELYGIANPTYPGQAHYISNGSVASVGHEFSCYTGTSMQPNMRVYNNANLQTGSNIYMDILGDGGRGIYGNSTSGWLCMMSGHTAGVGTDGSYIQMFSNGGTSRPGEIDIVSSAATNSAITFQWQPSSGGGRNNMAIYGDGRVVIAGPGNNVPDINSVTTNTYGLYVGDGILTEMVRVALHTSTDWADYVFNNDYNLLPLRKLEKYIGENRHLPDVPSAKDVKNEGIDVATMDATLLKKIEELTLYIIQQNKRIDELEKKIAKQQ